MDPNLQRLQIAQTLIEQLLPLIPPVNHSQAQVALTAAKTQLDALAAVAATPVVPLKAPVLVPPP